MINQILADTNKPAEVITVGAPCTFLSYSDRSPGIVTKVVDDRTIEVAGVRSQAKPNPDSKDGSYPYGSYITYNFFPEEVDYDRPHTTYTKRKNGTYQRKGCAYEKGNGSGRIALGYMDKYYDPSF